MSASTNRRAVLGAAILAAGAAAPVLANVVQAEPDPVLAIVAKLPAAWRGPRGSFEGPLVDEGHRVLDAAVAETKTPSTTLAGARAAIAWLVEYDDVPETSDNYLPTLLALADLPIAEDADRVVAQGEEARATPPQLHL